jgi:hypothetical protein
MTKEEQDNISAEFGKRFGFQHDIDKELNPRKDDLDRCVYVDLDKENKEENNEDIED